MFTPAHLRLPRRDRALLGGLLVALAVTAWLTLWLWEGSPASTVTAVETTEIDAGSIQLPADFTSA